ncbi:MAG: Maf family protein [Myxococcales bacterium]|nr:Maf family protein [Myxococcales bacterium]
MSAVWLASGSPRRRALLTWCGIEVEVHPADVDETRRPSDDPVAHAERLAATKGATAPEDRVVVAADTVVHQGDRIFDKPVDRSEAARHLAALSGAQHAVTTGVCVGRGTQHTVFSVTTRVRFRELSTAEIDAYLATGDADDKAGAYGIQGRAGAFVGEVVGSWTNVVGLPVEETLQVLRQLGVEPHHAR